MKIYKYAAAAVLLLITAFLAALFFFDLITVNQLDIVQVNDLKQRLLKNKSNEQQYDFDYSVIDNYGNLFVKTNDNITTDLNTAIIHRDTVINLENGDTLIIYNDTEDLLSGYKRSLLIILLITVFLIILVYTIILLYVDFNFCKPFYKLRAFAKNVAEGNLDIPLNMDKYNAFGAFTESFDLMREELDRAKSAEQEANKSKKELVASLSHDIKTPVASIKAVTELLSVKTNDAEVNNQLSVIEAKADQINALITNMFNATLEELQELKVNPTEQNSKILYDLIHDADHFQELEDFEIPECLILADSLRLSQIIDNIIINSYKYSGTKINIESYFTDNFLAISFYDYGKGVNEEELPYLFNKFYRAENAKGKPGAGLGLYISRYLANRMSGDVTCENTETGFKSNIILKLC